MTNRRPVSYLNLVHAGDEGWGAFACTHEVMAEGPEMRVEASGSSTRARATSRTGPTMKWPIGRGGRRSPQARLPREPDGLMLEDTRRGRRRSSLSWLYDDGWRKDCFSAAEADIKLLCHGKRGESADAWSLRLVFASPGKRPSRLSKPVPRAADAEALARGAGRSPPAAWESIFVSRPRPWPARRRAACSPCLAFVPRFPPMPAFMQGAAEVHGFLRPVPESESIDIQFYYA